MNSTINQILKKKKIIKKQINKKFSLLENRPQKSGVCLLTTIKNPKKPNSGSRHSAKISIKMFKQKLHNFKKTKEYIKRTCWISLRGQSPNLPVYSKVLMQGGREKDVIGMYYKGVRGNRGFEGVVDRKTSRSKYGTKKPK